MPNLETIKPTHYSETTVTLRRKTQPFSLLNEQAMPASVNGPVRLEDKAKAAAQWIRDTEMANDCEFLLDDIQEFDIIDVTVVVKELETKQT